MYDSTVISSSSARSVVIIIVAGVLTLLIENMNVFKKFKESIKKFKNLIVS